MLLSEIFMRTVGSSNQGGLTRQDSWQNAVTAQGTSRDKTTFGHFVQGNLLQLQDLSALFHHSDIARRIVDSRPEHCWRQGVTVQIDGASDEESFELQTDFTAIGALELLKRAHVNGRRDGLAAILLGAEDGLEPIEPLDLDRVKVFDWIREVEAFELVPSRYYRTGPNAGKVEVWRYSPLNGEQSGLEIHESRMILFGGLQTGKREKLENSQRDHSVLQPVHDVLRMFDTGWSSVENLLSDGYQTVMTVNGLASAMSADGGRSLEKRMRQMELYRSIRRPVVLDSGNTLAGTPPEKFDRTSVSFEQIPNILEKLMVRVCSAGRTPMTVLFGVSPAGLSATGKSDLSIWYDEIATDQISEHSPRVRRIAALLLAAKGKRVEEHEIKVIWPSLWQQTPLEEQQAEKLEAEIASILINNGALLPEEYFLSKFGGSAKSRISVGDESLEARRDSLKAFLTKTADTGSTRPEMTPSDQAKITTVREARAMLGFAPLGDERDDLMVSQLDAFNAAKAQATAATATPGEQLAANEKPDPQPSAKPDPSVPLRAPGSAEAEQRANASLGRGAPQEGATGGTGSTGSLPGDTGGAA
jgi:phage-related protein (TIGR01555 family)